METCAALAAWITHHGLKTKQSVNSVRRCKLPPLLFITWRRETARTKREGEGVKITVFPDFSFLIC